MLQSDRGGFALPMVIMVIGFMTAGVLAGFARSGSEVQVVDNQRAQINAFAVAEAGLESYMARGRITPADTTYSFAGGTAQVTSILIRQAATPEDTSMYLIRSVGSIQSASGRPLGTRTVAQLAYRVGGTMQVLSSWTSLSGLNKNGASGIIDGANACGTDTLPGVVVPVDGYSQTGGTGKGKGNDGKEVVKGDPPIDDTMTDGELADSVKIDWVGMVNPSAPSVMPDHVYCKSGSDGWEAGWACTDWPTSAQWTYYYANDMWPSIVINGTASLPSDGRGLLIVTGDLTLGGNQKWDGIILVGGKIVDNGSGNIAGAVVTGLNMKREDPWPSTVTESSQAQGTKDYEYDSCKVEAAAAGLMRLAQIPNAWVDNWTSW